MKNNKIPRTCVTSKDSASSTPKPCFLEINYRLFPKMNQILEVDHIWALGLLMFGYHFIIFLFLLKNVASLWKVMKLKVIKKLGWVY